VLEDHLPPPDTEVPRQLETPDSLMFQSASPEGASPALRSYLAGGLRDHRQLLTQANVLRHSSAQAGDGVGTCRAASDKPRVRLRRRLSSLRDGGSEEAGSQRVVRHAEYYFESGDIIFRVRGPIMNAVLTLDTDASTGGRYPISSTSLLLYARLGILSQNALPPATPRRFHKRSLR
jgi:hypothetical protein